MDMDRTRESRQIKPGEAAADADRRRRHSPGTLCCTLDLELEPAGLCFHCLARAPYCSCSTIQDSMTRTRHLLGVLRI